MSEQNGKHYDYSGGFFSPEIQYSFHISKSKAQEEMCNKSDVNIYSMIYIESGSANVVVNNKKSLLNKGDIYMCKPYENFSLFPQKDYDTIYFVVINIHPSVFEQLDKESKIYRAFEPRESSPVCVYKSEEISNTKVFFEKASSYRSLMLPLEAYKSILTLILFELCEVYDKSKQYIPAKFSHEYDLKIYAYIMSRAMTKITIKDVVDEFFVSKKYVDKVCHKFYNKNFSGLLKSVRMWGARGLIINNKTNKLEKISQLCGYNDYSAFYKNYKDFFGVSPKDDLMFYRKHKTFARTD